MRSYSLALGLAVYAASAGATGYTFTTITPTAPSTYTAAWEINNSGVVAGEWFDAAGIDHGYTYAGGSFTSFDAPGADGSRANGVAGTSGFGINAAGSIVGIYAAGSTAHGFVRDAGGTYTTLDLAGFANTVPVAINNLGTIAIQAWDTPTGTTSSFVRSASGVLTAINFPSSTQTAINGVNDAGGAVGFYLDAGGDSHGWVLAPGGVYTSLDNPAYGLVGPWGLNNAGWVVGEQDVTGASHGFVLDPQGHLTTFDVPGATYTYALGINDHGVIVGQYCGIGGVNGPCQSFLATPAVPEPGTLALWVGGLGLFGWRLRRTLPPR